MMLSNVFLKTLRDRRRSLLFWGIGLSLLAIMMAAFFPTIRDMPSLGDFMELLPAELMALFGGNFEDYNTPEGFLNGELFGFMYPLMLLIFSIGFAAGAVAGEEEEGTLDLLLSHPVKRWKLVTEKYAALVVSLLGIAAFFWVALLAAGGVIDMGLNPLRLAAVCFSGVLLATMFGAVALAIGCARGKKTLALGVAGALGFLSYIINGLAPLVDWLEPFRKFSPFYYYNAADPLTNGLDFGHAAILLGLAAVFLAVAVFTFRKRDLSV
jgi:ABC-2 type transport system permease protein